MVRAVLEGPMTPVIMQHEIHDSLKNIRATHPAAALYQIT